ncbi:Maf family protein [Thorsellia kenyensis]|uniref:dTTP/UTP pyrophosphatase n=1 Tax=Thorsellia kenyensis TaxID=1549888 RepID=A0ABV6CB98_9GAMM
MPLSIPHVYLASTSPRRAELLSLLNVNFSLLSINVPEIIQIGESPEEYVVRLAIDKATFGLGLTKGVDPIIAADTIGVLDKEILEKPKDEAEAIEMLMKLSNRTHTVYTGVCILNQTKQITELISTEVTFRQLGMDEIKSYVDTGDPFDKAGAYGIQGRAGAFVEAINGNYHNVVGLPLAHVSKLLKCFYDN